MPEHCSSHLSHEMAELTSRPVTNAIASYIVPLSRSIHYIQHGIPLGKERLLNLAPYYVSSLKAGNQNRYVYSKFSSSFHQYYD
jgi:hypothetical protein